MAKRRKRRRTKAKRNAPKRRRRRKKAYRRNPAKRRRRRRSYRKNSWKGAPRKHSRAAKLGWRRRKRKTTSRKRRKRRRAPSYVRRYRRRKRKKQSRKALRARRRNVRKALNKRYGVRKWTKHSRAKWNPGTALSLKGVTRSMTQAFSLEMLKDGAAVAGGIVGALALPALVQNVMPSAIRSRISLTSGWSGYVANFVSAGLVGYVAGLALGQSRGRLVLYGGLGAAMGKLLLDKVPGLSARTGVTLGGSSELDKLVEQEIAAQLATGGAGMGAYMSPGSAMKATALGDYVGPANVATAAALGSFPEFGDIEAAEF